QLLGAHHGWRVGARGGHRRVSGVGDTASRTAGHHGALLSATAWLGQAVPAAGRAARSRGFGGGKSCAASNSHDLPGRDTRAAIDDISRYHDSGKATEGKSSRWNRCGASVIAALLARLFRSRSRGELRAARRGDRDAIARFYDANVDGLYAFVYYRVGCD